MLTENDIILPKPNYDYITDEDSARRAMAELDRYDMLSMDTEGTGLNPYTSKVSLVQFGIPNKAFVFDVRCDTPHSSLHLDVLKPIMIGKQLKLLQNATFDMKMIKANYGYYIENIYDTMLVEQLLHLGLHPKASLDYLVNKYLGITMDKHPRDTFSNYKQEFKPYQLEYAANDVLVMPEIRNCQLPQIKNHGFEDVCRLEFEFTKPLCEMELNGMKLDVPKWRAIMSETAVDLEKAEQHIASLLAPIEDQTTLFGVSVIDVNSPLQLLGALKKCGLPIESTKNPELTKYRGMPIVDAVLRYRKYAKLISTYAEPLIEKINEITGRLHTEFRQMVATGRMSSSKPNLQNIPKKQMYRSCFIAPEGYKLITADMSGAELRILGNLSQDPIFIESYAQGIDLHARTASETFGVSMDDVTGSMRDAAKALNFGLCYGLSKFGLAIRLKISEKEADDIIINYFARYKGVKKFLDKSARDAIYKRYSRTISGRKRFYRLPPYTDPKFNTIKRGIERQAKNAGIQGANADTIKQSMIYLVDRLTTGGYDARLISTVHDEVIVEVAEDQVREVSEVTVQALKDGFGRYFSLIPMESDALVGPCWLKGACEKKGADGKKCGGTEMESVTTNDKFGTKIMCKKCGGEI